MKIDVADDNCDCSSFCLRVCVQRKQKDVRQHQPETDDIVNVIISLITVGHSIVSAAIANQPVKHQIKLIEIIITKLFTGRAKINGMSAFASR